MKTPFPQEAELTAVSIAYKNPDHVLIADEVSPRTPPLKSQFFKWTKMSDPHEAYRLQETRVSPTGKVNQLQLRGERVTDETEDDGIDIPLSYFDTTGDNEGIDVKRHATELGTSTILLRREVNVAGQIFNPANYVYKEQLQGDDQLNSENYAGNVITLFRTGMRKSLMKPNLFVFGDDSWAVVSQMPDIVKAIHGNDGDKGIVTPEQFARLFGIKQVVVGEGWICASKPGEDPVLSRVWGPHAAAIYRDRAAGTVGGVTFSFTAQFGNRVAGSLADPLNIGLRGGTIVRTGESTKCVVPAPHAGYFWEDLVAVD